MSYIYVRLAGGLGNQLYQAATALYFARGQADRIILLEGGLSSYSTIRKPDILKLLSNNWHTQNSDSINSVLSWLVVKARAGLWMPFIKINDKNFQKMQAYNAFDKCNLFLDGYFQRGWVKESFLSALSNLYLSKLSVENDINSAECLIHVRGGDFLELPLYDVIDVNYYCLAIEDAICKGWTDFAILTDDLIYAEKIKKEVQNRLKGVNIRLLSTSRNVIDDFYLLKNASARIIGNSSFAWWASALDEKKGRTWSPARMIITERRDLILDWEIVLNNPYMNRKDI
jgi:hypothetical protein